MKKKFSILILLLIFGFTQSIGQNLDLDYVTKWLEECDHNYEPKLVKFFFIDGKYEMLDSISYLNQILNNIQVSDINYIVYSKYKTCGYEPGKGQIFINSKSQKSSEDITGLIEFGIEIYDESRPKVILVNNKIQENIPFSELIHELDISKIYDIAISSNPVPKTVYGKNAENGIIKIWME